MAERLAGIIALIGAKKLARKLAKRGKRKEKEGEEKPPTPPATRNYRSALGYIFYGAGDELGRRLGLPTYIFEVYSHGKRRELPFQSHPHLGDLDRWKEYVKRRPYFTGEISGSLLALPLFSGTTGIILTRDGRLFHLPHGEDDFETVTNIWEPFLRYVEYRARKMEAEEHVPFPQAIGRVLRSLGLNSITTPEAGPLGGAEIAVIGEEPPEKKKQVLRALKKIYMDELGLDWMPIPLVHSDLHHINPEKSEFKKNNKMYLEELPNLLRELGVNPEDPLVKKRLEALRGLLYKIHWPDYWDARTALALVEALHSEGKITDQEYQEFLDLAARGEAQKLIARARQLAEKHAPPEEEKPAPGARILAHPDRYPALTQKVLLKTIILGQLQRKNSGIDRNLYRALRNLLTTPLTTSNWYPLLSKWFENLEKGRHMSPLTQIIQELPVHPALKQKTYQYLTQIEQGKPINQIPQHEKQAFKQTIEQIKQEIWKNPDKYAEILEKMAYTTGMNPRDAAKILVGVIDDLARIYAGEKTPRQVGLERDATQVLHTIKHLQDLGNYVDPYQLTQTLTDIIDQHIQDPLLRKAYHEAINHYTQTSHQVPRNHQYLEKLAEKERQLEEKLRQLTHEDRKLTEQEVKRIATLYRTLMLLTPHPTLAETKRFYAQLADRLKVKVGDEEFLPLHGPIAEDMATSYSAIRKTGPEERERTVRREIAGFEPLLHTTPHIEKKVTAILATTHQPEVPREKHEEFIRHLERTQMRRPIE